MSVAISARWGTFYPKCYGIYLVLRYHSNSSSLGGVQDIYCVLSLCFISRMFDRRQECFNGGSSLCWSTVTCEIDGDPQVLELEEWDSPLSSL